MKCMQCGSDMKTRRQAYLYDRDGIRATLKNLPLHHCPACGDFEVEIPHIDQLNQTLAASIIRNTARLTGAEIRFLRKQLGWSGTKLATQMGVEAETVSRWETGKKRIGAPAERLLRLSVSVGTPIDDYSLEDLANVSKADEGSAPMRFECSGDTWHMVA